MDVREKLEVAASARLPMTLFVPMVLIWPILGAFNFMLPVYVSNHGWTLFELGVLDAVFGLGMALIGVLVIIANTGRNLLVYLSALTALSVISTTMWWVMPDTLFLKALSLLILGMAFGGARVHIRVAIACRLRSVLAGTPENINRPPANAPTAAPPASSPYESQSYSGYHSPPATSAVAQ
ncbi:hypothetical protein [Pseudomonas halotolerans]|uniref:hypothetical protein n=1 Tax=Pseudomonas halotolerans TaxID=3143552 RepID=UPI0031D0A296